MKVQAEPGTVRITAIGEVRTASLASELCMFTWNMLPSQTAEMLGNAALAALLAVKLGSFL